MRLNDYQDLAMRTCSIPYEKKFDMLVHGVTGLVSEIEEANQCKKDDEHFTKELGDCMWMIAEICQASGLWFSTIVNEAQFHKNMKSANAIATLCGIVQKKYQGHEIDKEKIFNSLCSIMQSLLSWMQNAKIDLSDVLDINIEKLKARYPEGFDTEHSLHRADGDI